MYGTKIKKINLDDVLLLQIIGRQTFFETFAEENTPENMNKYLEEEFSINKLIGELEDKNVQFYIASFENKFIGYLKLNFGLSQKEIKENNAVEIERIYVLKEFHGKKIGQLLFEKAVKIALEKKADFIWLGVWEKNHRAIHFYKKNGFVEFDKHIFKLGEDLQTDLMMRLNITLIN
jgi:ribosomal protein S18 acetylase RimI-like enzyme